LTEVLERKKPVLLDHWRKMLEPLREKGIEVNPIGDYRMAVTAFIGTPEPEKLTVDEWYALAEADAAGYMHYAPTFRELRLKGSTSDRWWSNDPNRRFTSQWNRNSLQRNTQLASKRAWMAV
jgi:hypothetical protein